MPVFTWDKYAKDSNWREVQRERALLRQMTFAERKAYRIAKREASNGK